MPLHSEKLTSRQEVRGAISSQFWEQPVQSTRSLDGLSKTLPSEPPPLTQTGPSGLSRTQQLLASQALSIPAVPSFDGSEGGVVLDRVLARTGGKSWWAALSTRARAQRMVSSHRRGAKLGETLRDLNNYSLCARFRSSIGKRATANAMFEVPNVHEFKEDLKAQGVVHTLQTSGDASLYKGQAWLKYQLPGHEVQAMATRNMEYLDSAAAYCGVPLALSLDLASNVRADGIQYRAGVHQATAPKVERSQDAKVGPSSSERHVESSLHFQGAVAVEGEAMLWKPSAERSSWPQARRSKDPFQDPFPEPWRLGEGDAAGESDEEAYATHSQEYSMPVESQFAASSSEAAAPTSARSAKEPASTSSTQLPDGWDDADDSSKQWLRPVNWQDSTIAGLRGGRQDSGDVQSRAARNTNSVSSAFGSRGGLPGVASAREVWRPQESPQHSYMSQALEKLGQGPVLEGVSAEGIQEGVLHAKETVDSVREKVGGVVRQVRGGMQSYQHRGAGRADRKRRARHIPYSPLLAEPFIKVMGAVGCLARVPLPHQAFHINYPAASANGADLGSETRLPPRFSQELWTPYLRDTALRVFASCGLSAQYGKFARRFGDYTAATLRLDLGLTSPDNPGNADMDGAPLARAPSATGINHNGQAERPGNPLFRHRAFALEGRGVWHALSASFAQQVFGPVRMRLDARLALDTTPQMEQQGARGRPTLRTLAAGAPWLQPVLLETVWGLDVVLPGSKGAARGCAWVSPVRREAMLELRLF